MTDKVRSFIEKYIELIDTDWFEGLFIRAAQELSTDEVFHLAEALETALNIETESIRWKVIDSQVIEYINTNLNVPAYQRDKSNSWARVDYMLDAINDMGFGWHEAKDHIIKNCSTYNTPVIKLEPQYGWMGAGDYAFKWFDKKAFEQEYIDE